MSEQIETEKEGNKVPWIFISMIVTLFAVVVVVWIIFFNIAQEVGVERIERKPVGNEAEAKRGSGPEIENLENEEG